MQALATRDDVFAGMDEEDLKQEIRRLMKNHAISLVELAKAVSAAHDRGIDLSGVVHSRYLDGLRRIAAGELLPEFTENYLETPAWPQLKMLPVHDQRAQGQNIQTFARDAGQTFQRLAALAR